MNNHEDEKEIMEMLSSLKDKMHIPDALILADAKGELSEKGHLIVQDHIQECKECAETFALAKESIAVEKEYDTVCREAVEVPPMSADLKAKTKLVALLNSKRDQIVEEIAKLFLPEEQWFVIKPVISASKHEIDTSVETDDVQVGRFKAAAFSKSTPGTDKVFETIEKVIEYVGQVCDLLLEFCANEQDIENKLDAVLEKSISILPKHDKEQVKSCILAVIKADIEK
jgi:hypothetical protein